jgi:ATP-dependent Clp protease adaptor protein ClpS
MTESQPQMQQDALTTGVQLEIAGQLAGEERWLVLVHNDDVTPLDYVLRILTNLFLLSEEVAEHVAQTAHTDGQAVVVVRPRLEAERMVKVARARVRLDGYPLTFTLEPEV